MTKDRLAALKAVSDVFFYRPVPLFVTLPESLQLAYFFSNFVLNKKLRFKSEFKFCTW
jgi:hypothetical protein